ARPRRRRRRVAPGRTPLGARRARRLKWFEEHLPNPDFYADGNIVGAVTWFRTPAPEQMQERVDAIARSSRRTASTDAAPSPGGRPPSDKSLRAAHCRGYPRRVINRLDLRGRSLSARELSAVLPRPEVGVEDASRLVAPVVEDVRARGAAALRDYAEKFDHVRPEHLRVP